MIAGIDPGKSGAIAFIDNSKIVSVEDLPIIGKHLNADALTDILQEYRPDFVLIEQVGAMPGQGSSSGFNFGRNYGSIIGVVSALHIARAYVSPQKWKKQFGLSSDKNLSRARATDLFPEFAQSFKRVKDDGKAEACLIALYSSMMMNNVQ